MSHTKYSQVLCDVSLYLRTEWRLESQYNSVHNVTEWRRKWLFKKKNYKGEIRWQSYALNVLLFFLFLEVTDIQPLPDSELFLPSEPTLNPHLPT